MWSCAGWAGIDVSPTDAALVTAVTIAAQTVAITPGGIGTYEAAATAAFVGLGADPGAALAAAVAAHALKTGLRPGRRRRRGRVRRRPACSAACGSPAPRPRGARRRARIRATGAPVVLVLPAHDEEATVAAVVAPRPRARSPAARCG